MRSAAAAAACSSASGRCSSLAYAYSMLLAHTFRHTASRVLTGKSYLKYSLTVQLRLKWTRQFWNWHQASEHNQASRYRNKIPFSMETHCAFVQLHRCKSSHSPYSRKPYLRFWLVNVESCACAAPARALSASTFGQKSARPT